MSTYKQWNVNKHGLLLQYVEHHNLDQHHPDPRVQPANVVVQPMVRIGSLLGSREATLASTTQEVAAHGVATRSCLGRGQVAAPTSGRTVQQVQVYRHSAHPVCH